jgi:hypothetical protein
MKKTTENPKPLIDIGFTTVWNREDLDQPGEYRSKVWTNFVRTPIKEALLKLAFEPKAFFDLSVNWGMFSDIGKGVRDYQMIERLPDSCEANEALRNGTIDKLVDRLDRAVWARFAETSDFEYFEIAISAMTISEIEIEAIKQFTTTVDELEEIKQA